MKNLMTNTAFGDYVDPLLQTEEITLTKAYLLRRNFDNFVSRPLQLGFFVPCDLEGNVLSEPETDDPLFDALWDAYNEAKSRVLFEGVPIEAAKHHISQGRTIEYLANFGTVVLTDSARKEIGI